MAATNRPDILGKVRSLEKAKKYNLWISNKRDIRLNHCIRAVRGFGINFKYI